jgi:hypothetical protein
MGREVVIDESAVKSPVRFAMTKAIEGGTSGALAMGIQVCNVTIIKYVLHFVKINLTLIRNI